MHGCGRLKFAMPTVCAMEKRERTLDRLLRARRRDGRHHGRYTAGVCGQPRGRLGGDDAPRA